MPPLPAPQEDLLPEAPTAPQPALPTREQIVRLQSEMLAHATAQPIPQHHFAPGMYMRELTVPKDMLIVGKTHRHAHFLFVMAGRAVVVSEFGGEIVEAGYFGISVPGVKRVVYALEDTLFLTVHANKDDSQDLEVIEAEHIVPETLGLEMPRPEMLQ